MTKKITLSKGEKISYQTFLEEIVGPFLAEHLPWIPSSGEPDYENGIGIEDDYIMADADYEILIVKKRTE